MADMEYASRLDSASRLHMIKRVLWIVLFLNVAVAVAKYGYGVMSNTVSMQADGIHSLFDGTGNIIGLIGMAMAGRPADYDHPYGHAKFETYASVFIGVLLLIAAYVVASEAIGDLVNGTSSPEVSTASFIIMLSTLAMNIFVTTWEHRQAKRLGSEILGADARHTLSDVLVTIGVIIGLIFIRFGYIVMDSIMSLVVAVAIIYTAFEVFKQANSTLSDRARIPSEEIERCALGVSHVHDCHRVRTRGSENEVYADLHILVDGNMTVSDAHMTGDEVQSLLKERFPQIVEVMVHIEPDTPRERSEGDSADNGPR